MMALHDGRRVAARWVEGDDVSGSPSGDQRRTPVPAAPPPGAASRLASVAAVLLTVLASRWRTDHSNPWRPARSFAAAADSISRLIPAGAPVMVLGEPPLAFYLHQRGHPAFRRVTAVMLDAETEPGYLVVGRYASSAPLLRARLDARAQRLTLLDTIFVAPTDLRLLDDLAPELATRYRERPDGRYELVLYRHVPAVSGTSP
jgi:hypothetical protein